MATAPIESVAQQIIDAVIPLVGERTINIMDTQGIIIASSDHTRIGTFHKGAQEVAATGNPVHIQPENVSCYPGAKEGINLPIIKHGRLLGVVGIFGQPHEVEHAANLLSVCVGLYLDQASAAHDMQLRRDLRHRLLQTLIQGDDPDREDRLSDRRDPSTRPRLPMRAVVVSIGLMPVTRQQRADLLDRVEKRLLTEGWIDENLDVYGVVEENLVLFKHITEHFHTRRYLQVMRDSLSLELKHPVTISIGGPANQWQELPYSYREAVALGAMGQDQCLDMECSEHKVLYLMGRLSDDSLSRYVGARYKALTAGFQRRNMTWVMETVESYCRCGQSISAAARSLHIHKNTMGYRIGKILSLTGLEEERGFVREYFLRLILLYHQRIGKGD